jgi:hypothetical protein
MACCLSREAALCWFALIPLLVRRGGRDIKKMLRSLLNGADGVVAYTSCFKMACERPPRLRGIRWLRAFFINRAASPPHEEGNMSP